MKLKFKKFVYLINDFTNLLLKRDQNVLEERLGALQKTVIALGVMLLLSLVLNVVLLYVL